MMGEQKSEPQLFSYAVNLEKWVRSDHPLRRVAKLIDFKFVREEVPPCYGSKGNVFVINWEDRSRWFPTPTP